MLKTKNRRLLIYAPKCLFTQQSAFVEFGGMLFAPWSFFNSGYEGMRVCVKDRYKKTEFEHLCLCESLQPYNFKYIIREERGVELSQIEFAVQLFAHC